VKLATHPAADVWPMLPADELESLADSILEVGLLEPIVRWADPTTGEVMLLDGRNRLAACKLAKVEPTYIDVTGDPVAYVLARNESRRHMSKGQRAMAAWMTSASGAQSLGSRPVAERAGLSHGMVDMAKVVAEHAPDLVSLVIAGSRPLKDAYDEARSRRDAANSETARMERLPADLAGQVRDEALSLSEAEAAAKQRDQERLDRQRDARTLLTRIIDLTIPSAEPLGPEFVSAWRDRIGDIATDDPDVLDRLDSTIATLTNLRKELS
jgi:hypothetical protein